MTTLWKRITPLSQISGLLSIMLVAGSAAIAEGPMPGGGNPPMPPSLDAASASSVASHFISPVPFMSGSVSVLEGPMPGGGNPPMPPSLDEGPMPGGGNPPMPPSLDLARAGSQWNYYVNLVAGLRQISLMEGPMPGGGNPPMPPSLDEGPMPGGGNPPMPPSLDEGPMPGGGNPPMPPSLCEGPMPGGGSPPMPPSVAVVAVIGGVSLYADGTLGYPNGDFQFTSGAYLWADGFVRFSPAPGDYVWTNYAGVIINTALGDVAANGLPHVEYPVLTGLFAN